MKTAECEGIEAAGGLLAGACAARVVSVEPIAGGHNVKAVVETAAYGEKTVVCGAPNCRPGMITAYVPVGKKEIHGVESDGMLASGAELGINRDPAGILETGAGRCAQPAALPDSIIEIDNKSITHRPDLWGHHGMAREVAAILRKPLRDPVRLAAAQRVPRRSRSRSKTSTCARDTARWCSKTSRCGLRPFGCNTGSRPSG